MKLIHEATGHEAKVGDTVQTWRGGTDTLEFFREPHKPSSEGKVVLRNGGEVYCGVAGLKWIEREDRGEPVSNPALKLGQAKVLIPITRRG